MPLPLSPKHLESHVPEKFKVLVYADDSHSLLSESIVKAMPYVDFQVVDGAPVKMADFTVLLRLARVPVLCDQDKKALINGRYMISNIQAPYAGFLSQEKGLHDFKHKIVEKIASYRGVKEINHKAQRHYLEALHPRTYKAFLENLAVEARTQKKGEPVHA